METTEIRNEDIAAVIGELPEEERQPETVPESEAPAGDASGQVADVPPQPAAPPEEDGSDDGDEPAPEGEEAKAKAPAAPTEPKKQTEDETRKADWAGLKGVEYVPSIFAPSSILGRPFGTVSHVVGLHGRRITEFREICRQGDLPRKIAVTLFGRVAPYLYVVPEGGELQPLLDLFADEGWSCGKDSDYEILPRTEPVDKSGIAYGGGVFGTVAVPFGFRDTKQEVSLRFDPHRPRVQQVILAEFTSREDRKGFPSFGSEGDETSFETVGDFLAKHPSMGTSIAGAGRRALQVFFYKTCLSRVDEQFTLMTRAVRKDDKGQTLLLSITRELSTGRYESAQAVWYYAGPEGIRRDGPVVRLRTSGSEVKSDAELGDFAEVVEKMEPDFIYITTRGGKTNGVKVNGAAKPNGDNVGKEIDRAMAEKQNGKPNNRKGAKHPNDKFGGRKNRDTDSDTDPDYDVK